MINVDPTLDEREIYPQVPAADRWIFNKLEVAERQGFKCGPSGVPIVDPGVYCIRPIYNLAGMADGGVRRFVFDGTNQPDIIPGWFWCQWFNGYHEWVSFTDGVPVDWSGGTRQGRLLVLTDNDPAGPRNTRYPNLIADISKHMLIEYIGGKIIEVAPRHQYFIPGKMNQVNFRAVKWEDPYFGRETFYWKAVDK